MSGRQNQKYSSVQFLVRFHVKPKTFSTDGHLPMSKVVFIGSGDLEVQRTELIRVVLPSCRVVPLQNPELASFVRLSLQRIVGVHQNLLPLQAGTQAELQLEP